MPSHQIRREDSARRRTESADAHRDRRALERNDLAVVRRRRMDRQAVRSGGAAAARDGARRSELARGARGRAVGSDAEEGAPQRRAERRARKRRSREGQAKSEGQAKGEAQAKSEAQGQGQKAGKARQAKTPQGQGRTQEETRGPTEAHRGEAQEQAQGQGEGR